MDLSKLRIDYLFLDGTNFRFHEHSPAEPVLCAWGIDTDGKPHLAGLAAASSESTDAWVGFLGDLVTRNLAAPLLVVSDGTPGLIAAIEQVFPVRCAKDASSTGSATQSPRSPRPTRTPSRPTGGRSSTRSRNHPARSGRRSSSAHRRLPGPVGARLSRSGRLPGRGLREPQRAPPVPERTLEEMPAHQLDRAHLRREHVGGPR